ncbi:hypothetical protein [Streptomyces griseomycini]|uniref:Uncharacterized protein n=1 Tax=Streptomyces griseomycini TaxID=66895 RepID=A0A7W7VAG9_9ACTN|nr:hypothetical protein [Streptomyces griseomycini]MBB4902986.1 hypothetical protein [Streptomyces griseomycini]
MGDRTEALVPDDPVRGRWRAVDGTGETILSAVPVADADDDIDRMITMR